jgi:hypothetical protein
MGHFGARANISLRRSGATVSLDDGARSRPHPQCPCDELWSEHG